MKPIFYTITPPLLRLFLAVIVSCALFFADSRVHFYSPVRNYVETLVSPFYFMTNRSREFLDNLATRFKGQEKLHTENKLLYRELFLKNSDLLLLAQYKQENQQLRTLLRSPLRKDEYKMFTQVVASNTDPYTDQVLIDKGKLNDVFPGQSVINDQGVVGQVMAVGKSTSRVLLICDATHALPIQILRNDFRAIAAGTGCMGDLKLEDLPANTDIRVGDLLVTSGLGGRFPEGYPVAIVSSVKKDTQRAYTIAEAHPTADLRRLRYLLLLWGAGKNQEENLLPTKVHDVASERMIQKEIQEENLEKFPSDVDSENDNNAQPKNPEARLSPEENQSSPNPTIDDHTGAPPS